MGGTILIQADGKPQIKRDLDKVLIIGTDSDTPREILAMQDTLRVLSVLDPDEAQRVVNWLRAKFPE